MQAAAEWVCSQMRHTVGNRYAGKRIAAIECKIADAEQMVGQRQVGKVSAAGKSMISDAGYRLGNDQTGKNSAFRERIVADAAKTVRKRYGDALLKVGSRKSAAAGNLLTERREVQPEQIRAADQFLFDFVDEHIVDDFQKGMIRREYELCKIIAISKRVYADAFQTVRKR